MKQYQPNTCVQVYSQYQFSMPASGGQSSIFGNNTFFSRDFFLKKRRVGELK